MTDNEYKEALEKCKKELREHYERQKAGWWQLSHEEAEKASKTIPSSAYLHAC